MRTPNEHKKYVAPGFRKGFSVDAEGTEHSETSRAVWNGGDCIRRKAGRLAALIEELHRKTRCDLLINIQHGMGIKMNVHQYTPDADDESA